MAILYGGKKCNYGRATNYLKNGGLFSKPIPERFRFFSMKIARKKIYPTKRARLHSYK
jgi:hypothetical protein